MLCTEASPSATQQLMPPSKNCNSSSSSPASSSSNHKSFTNTSTEEEEEEEGEEDDVKNGNSPNPIRRGHQLQQQQQQRSFLDSQTSIDVATLQFLNSHNENSDDEGDDDDDKMQNSSLNGFDISRRPPIIDSENESEDDDDAKSSSAESTSCSENSFEMSSATSFASTLNKADQQPLSPQAQIETGEGTPILTTSSMARLSPPKMLSIESNFTKRGPSYSQSMDSFLLQKPLSPQAREQISQELSELDTGLPQLDFKSLEEKLSTAAKEHEALERRKLGDEVRRRLALQYDSYTAGPSPVVNTRPHRSNFAQRLNASKNLQVCYMNDLAEDDEDQSDSEDDDVDDDEDDDDDDFASSSFVPKSKSTPNLTGMRRGINGSKLNASELARRAQPDAVGFHDRLTLLRDETQLMLQQAKKAAKMQMEVERQNHPILEKVESKKLSRMQLSKMKIEELKEILEEIKNKIDVANGDLVSLLMEKDSLYMQQDSQLVDIEDEINFVKSSESLNLPSFLYVKSPVASPSSAPPTSRHKNTSNSSSISSSSSGIIFDPSKWKIFKR